MDSFTYTHHPTFSYWHHKKCHCLLEIINGSLTSKIILKLQFHKFSRSQVFFMHSIFSTNINNSNERKTDTNKHGNKRQTDLDLLLQDVCGSCAHALNFNGRALSCPWHFLFLKVWMKRFIPHFSQSPDIIYRLLLEENNSKALIAVEPLTWLIAS